MFESLRQAVIREADKPRATRALFVVAFMESSFFPIPPDALLAPMVLRRPHEWLKLAAICTLGSILGGILGYAIGYFLMDSVAGWVIDGYHLRAGVDKFQALFAEYGAAIILLKGLTPIPYKLVTIASGAAHYPLGTFIVLSAITRGARFLLVAGGLRAIKDEWRAHIEKHLVWWMLGILAIALAAAALALKMM